MESGQKVIETPTKNKQYFNIHLPPEQQCRCQELEKLAQEHEELLQELEEVKADNMILS